MGRVKAKLRLILLTALATGAALLVLHTLLVLEPLPPPWISLLSPVERDLPEISRDGVLRVAMCPDDVAFFERDGRPQGLAYEIAQRIARRLGVRLEPVAAANPAAGIREVLRGRADMLAVVDAGPAPGLDPVLWTSSFETSHPVVLGREGAEIRRLEDLRGRRVAVTRYSAFEAVALRWRDKLGKQMEIDRLPVVLSTRDVVAGAARGAWPLVLMDQDRARLEATLYGPLSLSPPLDAALPVRWALRPSSPQLARVASKALDELRVVGLIADLERKYLEDPAQLGALRRPPLPPGSPATSPWDSLFQHAAELHGLDWRLLAALSFAESGYDAEGVGPGGALGLMQLMPSTARAFGADDPLDPAQNVEAGAKHLSWLFELLADVPAADRLAFTLAAYNMGIGHLEDARRLAAEKGLDPSRWADNVALVLPLLEDPAAAGRLPHGRARGAFTAHYVARVLDLYRSYAGRTPTAKSASASRFGRS